jgi:hypothetical protein
MPQTVTGSLETELSADQILQFVADPRHLPEWAPGFADSVAREQGDYWRITKAERVLAIEVVVDRTRRTVDFLREIAPGRKSGASIRVLDLPAGGSVIVMTLPVIPGTAPESVATILDQELRDMVTLAAAA